jgi:peroxiredoxin
LAISWLNFLKWELFTRVSVIFATIQNKKIATLMHQISRSLLLIFPLFIITVACNTTHTGREGGEVHISGQFDIKTPAQLLFEELTFSEVISVDTIRIDEEGFFNYRFYIEHAGFYRLKVSDEDYISLAVEPGQEIHLGGSLKNLRETYSVTGSEGSQILWQINKMVSSGQKKVDSLRTVYRSSKNKPEFIEINKNIKKQYEDLRQQQTRFIINIIDNNQESLASILALYQVFEDKHLLDEKKHFNYYENLSRSLGAVYPHNKHVINLKKRVSDLKREEELRLENEASLANGKPAPEIILPDTSGTHISLSSFKNNLVLVDFWAAWCPPCREANKVLNNLYSQYNSKGFEIYSISLDRNKEQWVNAIRNDNIGWTQVSDLRFMNSPVVSTYNVTEVPHYILIDRQGRIISRNFTLQQLETLIRENI